MTLQAVSLLCLFVRFEKIFWSLTISSSKTNFAANVNSIATSTSKYGSLGAVLVAAGSSLSFSTKSVGRCFDSQKASSANLMDPLRQTAFWHSRAGLDFFHPKLFCI